MTIEELFYLLGTVKGNPRVFTFDRGIKDLGVLHIWCHQKFKSKILKLHWSSILHIGVIIKVKSKSHIELKKLCNGSQFSYCMDFKESLESQ